MPTQYYLQEKDRPIEVTTLEVTNVVEVEEIIVETTKIMGTTDITAATEITLTTKIMVIVETIITRPITIKEVVEIIEDKTTTKVPATTATHHKTIMSALPSQFRETHRPLKLRGIKNTNGVYN